ncbi:MAG: hypothetical protein EOP45_13735 [Sphingobacteriaceae bacterium]|nr:MAG: hypothetical protein EOP45_13735 [Sphingobacteriaceae bacterium]
MKSSLLLAVAVTFYGTAAHLFGRSEPHESITVSLRTSTEIAIPTHVSTKAITTTQTVTFPPVTTTETECVTQIQTEIQESFVTRTALETVIVPHTLPAITHVSTLPARTVQNTIHKYHTIPPVTETSTALQVSTKTTIHVSTLPVVTNHVQPTVNVYELEPTATMQPIPHDSQLRKRIVLDVLVRDEARYHLNATDPFIKTVVGEDQLLYRKTSGSSPTYISTLCITMILTAMMMT